VKITARWLAELVPNGDTPAQLAAHLTAVGLEVESVTAVAPPSSGVVVGEVLECGRHPDAEKLALCTVTTDGSDRLQIICGAPNVRSGLKVAVAKIGAELPGGITIRRAKLRGLESEGMLCSARELGLGVEHDGILELPPDLALGRDLRDALDLDDTVLEVNATPNRGDCMSVVGIARDYAAARQRRYLKVTPPAVAAAIADVVAAGSSAGSACPRFGSRVIRGLKPGLQSPQWMRERLRRIGINSISLVVDVTNYVMSELGQPLHAYDLGRLGQGLEVRMAQAGEALMLLDDREYTLDEQFVVVADNSGAIGLAGIMGGRSTAISDATTDVLLEAAHWAPAAIAAGSRRLGLFTDAAQRFERGVDPELPRQALERATALILESAGGHPGPVRIEEFAPVAVGGSVTLRRERLARLLGTTVPDEEVAAVLHAISETVETSEDGWRVVAPSHRFDLRIEVDLIEEVARLRGFDGIPEQHAAAPQVAGFATEQRVAAERLLVGMIDRGYREAITYSFVDPALQELLFPDAAVLKLSNAISAELSVMRVSLWPGLLQAARENLHRQQPRVRLFEMGRKFVPAGAELTEIETLAGIVAGSRLPEQWGAAREGADFYDVKADIEALFALTGQGAALRFEAAACAPLRPGRTARIYRDGVAVGWIGELHPRLLRSLGLNISPVLFELETAVGFTSNSLKYKNISKFPSVRRDLAVVVAERVTLAELQETVTFSASGLLTDLKIFDVYRGPGIDSGRKSIALGLILQDSSRTLTDKDADAVVSAVIARLRDDLSATIRD
jgi:phenylalanyl-tRNA synthetase beta chain